MGTNYYTATKKCKECGHKPEGIHLGKSSLGWTFTFQYNGGQYYKNVKEMKKWLKGKKIENEYEEIISHKDFWAMVKSKQKEKSNHAMEVFKVTASDRDFVIDGHSFTDCEFS